MEGAAYHKSQAEYYRCTFSEGGGKTIDTASQQTADIQELRLA